MRAVEEHTRFSIENHIRAQRSYNPDRTARRLWLEVRRALVGQMLDLSRPFNHRDGPFVLDVTLSKMRKHSTNHGRSDEGENAMRISRRNMLTGGVSALTAAAAPAPWPRGSRAIATQTRPYRFSIRASQSIASTMPASNASPSACAGPRDRSGSAMAAISYGPMPRSIVSPVGMRRRARSDLPQTGEQAQRSYAGPPGPAPHLRARRPTGHAHGIRRNDHGVD